MDTQFLAEYEVMDYSLLCGVVEIQEFGEMDKRFYLQDRKTKHPNLFYDNEFVYVFGVIDILQTYNFSKRIERFSKLLRY
jgi:hypothetical protein